MEDDHYCHDARGTVVISMKSQSGGQSSHNAGDDRKPKLALAWYDVPPDRLWRFVVDLVAEHKLREVAETAGLSKETVRKYIQRIGDPKTTTRKALGELFLKEFPGGAVADPTSETEKSDLPPLRKQLIQLLPRGEKEALATLSVMFGLLRNFPQHVPTRVVDAVHHWLELQVEGEYDYERFYAQFAKRERKPKSVASKTSETSKTGSRGRKPAAGAKRNDAGEPRPRKRKTDDRGGEEG